MVLFTNGNGVVVLSSTKYRKEDNCEKCGKLTTDKTPDGFHFICAEHMGKLK